MNLFCRRQPIVLELHPAVSVNWGQFQSGPVLMRSRRFKLLIRPEGRKPPYSSLVSGRLYESFSLKKTFLFKNSAPAAAQARKFDPLDPIFTNQQMRSYANSTAVTSTLIFENGFQFYEIYDGKLLIKFLKIEHWTRKWQ